MGSNIGLSYKQMIRKRVNPINITEYKCCIQM